MSGSLGFSFGFGSPNDDRPPVSEKTIQNEYLSSEDQWPAPLVIEPGLSSLIWPVSIETFLSSYYSKRPLASHVEGSERRSNRLQRLQKEMHDFDVPSLIREATRVVVWMKDLRTGMMNYIDLPPEIAIACYHSGHSLYFNPPIEFQRKYISAICEDLGMSFGASLDGGFGGDVEIFAVKGTHVTPRHFDAQENFTVQLVGSKKWSVSSHPEVLHPTTNLHPQSTNRAAYCADSRTLVASGRESRIEGGGGERHSRKKGTDHEIAAPSADAGDGSVFSLDDIKMFELSPGSTFYLPAGCSHEVICDEPTGSLSINFSISGVRWADFIAKRVMQTMLQDSDARGRIHLVNGSLIDTRHHLKQMLNRLAKSLTLEMSTSSSSNTANISDGWLPDGIIELNKRRIALYDVENIDDDEDGKEEGGGDHLGTGGTVDMSHIHRKRKRTFAHMSGSMSSRRKENVDDGEAAGDEYGEGVEVDAEVIVSTDLSDKVYDSTQHGKSVILQRNPVTLMMIYSERDVPERLQRQERGLIRVFSGMGSIINSDAHQLSAPDYSVWISFPRSMKVEIERMCKPPPFYRAVSASSSLATSSANGGNGVASSVLEHKFGESTTTLDVLIQILIHIGFFVIIR